ncbi:MAG: M20 family metallo-hydrolase [Cyclobacteriaceae bacterium]|nr:M20 family metallo-hydrolase [Cyclobacteriaceae bacterium HetDA_MAG_MS6]
MEVNRQTYYDEALALLSQLIQTPSFSKEENDTAEIIDQFLVDHGVATYRKGHNVWAQNKYFDPDKETILLNSHHDTVKPNKGYSNDPFKPIQRDGKLYGLGSNDAGGCLVSLIMTFIHFYEQQLPWNLIIAATAEEENSGSGGVESILSDLKPITFGVVGEPTEMKMGVAEKGLMVLDCEAKGKAGHAARDQGINAIYKALSDIEWFRTFEFDKESEFLGPIKMSVTMIESGYQHNVVPDTCKFVVDVRTTDSYSNTEVLDIIRQHVSCKVTPRSTRLNPSSLPSSLAISKVADQLGIDKFGSPTTSDQAVMDFPTFKMGPGRSERSHTPDEFIYLDEIDSGIQGYIRLLQNLFDQEN